VSPSAWLRSPTSLRWRLLLALLSLLLGAAAVMGWVTYRSVLTQTEDLFDYQLRQMALSLRDQGEVGAADAQALANERLDFVVQIWSADGRVIYATQIHDALPNRAQLGYADVQVGPRVWRAFSVATLGRVIQVAQPLAIRRGLAADAAWRSVAPLMLLAPLLALAVWGVAALTLMPLRRLASDVRSRDARSLQPLPTAGLPDEVAPVVSALNDLLQRLGAALQAQRDFVADAAHELRSPLTALKLQLHVLHVAADDTARAHAVSDLAAGIDRASRLVEQLLALARAEPDAPIQHMETLDLVQLVQSELAALAPLARQRGTTLSLLPPAEMGESDTRMTVRGHLASLTSLVRNLVDNAIRHTPEGTQVQVRVARAPDTGLPMLVIDDAGAGLPEPDRERAFDRFFRRADDSTTGSGLGLAIVHAVAQRHGATVTLAESPLGGLRATVRFPAQL
jgi:two-component system OmpR family sensor kinase/two-component system sensor histidine kinase QseC